MSLKKIKLSHSSIIGYIIELHLAIAVYIAVVLITDNIEHETISNVLLVWSMFVVLISAVRSIVYIVDPNDILSENQSICNNHIDLSPQQYSKLSQLAKKLEKSKSDTIDELMELYSQS